MKVVNINLNEEDTQRLEVIKRYLNTRMNTCAIRWILLQAAEKILSKNVNIGVIRHD